MSKKLQFFILFFLIGCTHGKIHNNHVEVSDEYIGTWEQTKNCKVHKTMQGNVKIERSAAHPEELKVQWVNRDFSTFNGVGQFNYIDMEKKSYQISSDVETFNDGKTVIIATIWKRTQGDVKNLALIMKKYMLNEKGELIYEKYGYTAFEENKKSQIKSYSEFFPDNYHCVMTRKR